MLFIICMKVLGQYSAMFGKNSSNYKFELSNETNRIKKIYLTISTTMMTIQPITGKCDKASLLKFKAEAK